MYLLQYFKLDLRLLIEMIYVNAAVKRQSHKH